ncbi:MAG: hypothetical protein GPJ52_00940 [Candidatus Heimdallarchaeota archaeon]|nr:hypothetical protein [Candidatus Heimdallarchaeota archaeon]
MKIELFLRKINQDRIIEQLKPTKGVDRSVEWIVSWPKSCCILDFSKVPDSDAVVKPGYLLREEKVGGMLWDPRSNAVYKLDEEAYHTIIEMEHFKDPAKVAERVGVNEKEVIEFINQLRELKIH